MGEIASNSKSSGKGDQYGIPALVVATLLFLAIGDWPYGYYQFLRIATFALSAAIVHREWQRDRKGWLLFAGVGAFLFNPIFPLRMDKGDWSLADLVFAIGYGSYGIEAITKKVATIFSFAICIVLAGTFILTFYVNRYMPRGPSYPTGEIVCQNDGRGPCGEAYEEDMSVIDIPEWAKFLRRNFVGIYMLLVTSGICCHAKGRSE